MPTEFCVGRNPEVVVAEARSQAVEAAEASLGEEGIQVEVVGEVCCLEVAARMPGLYPVTAACDQEVLAVRRVPQQESELGSKV